MRPLASLRRYLARLRPLRRLYYQLTGSLAYSRFIVDRQQLEQAVAHNRQTLGRVKRWIDDETLANSVFRYGMPDHVRALIDTPLGAGATYSDLLVVLARAHGPGLRYLELGPSVGKNLFQISQAVANAELCAIDIEDINPVLAGFFEPVAVETWTLAASTMRQRPAHDSRFVDPVRSNRLRYIAGDLFDGSTWDRLAGLQFDLVFSDAFHSPDALLGEWHNLRDWNLLSDQGFVMVWDDLTSRPMRAAFDAIAKDMARHFGPAEVAASIELFDGWIGTGEPPHPVGLVRYQPVRAV